MSLDAMSLEEALAKTDADADAALKAASAAIRSLKKFRAAASSGDLRELRRAMDTAEQSIIALRQQFANAKEGWDFDEEAYLTGGDFTRELLETARKSRVEIFEDGERGRFAEMRLEIDLQRRDDLRRHQEGTTERFRTLDSLQHDLFADIDRHLGQTGCRA